MRKIIIAFILVFLVAFSPLISVDSSPSSFAVEEEMPEVIPAPPLEPIMVKAPEKAAGAYAVDTVTGKVLTSKKPNKSMPAASMSKLMTIYLVHQKINKGASWSKKIKITDSKIEKLSRSGPFGGSIRLKKGKTFTVRQLYNLTLVESNNAAAIQLGRWVSGSDKKFVKLMNSTAKKMGMRNSKFYNACGLDNIYFKKNLKKLKFKIIGKKNQTNMMSPKDATILATALIEKYPEVLKTTNSKKKTVKGQNIKSSNLFFRDKKYIKAATSLKIDGLKTGFTDKSGLCLISTCAPNGRNRIITVVFDDKKRYDDTISLIKNIYKTNVGRL